MPLLGQGAMGAPADYSAVGDSAWRLASSNSSAIAQAMGKVEDFAEKRKEAKDNAKSGERIAKAFLELNPGSAKLIDPILADLKNEDISVTERGQIGGQTADLINLYMGHIKDERSYGLDVAQSNRADRGLAIEEDRHKIDVDGINRLMAEKQQLTEFMARPALERVLGETVQAEKRGERPLIDSERLKSAFLKAPAEQMQIVNAAMQGLPKAAPLEFRDVEFTRDGMPTKGTAAYDASTGQFQLVPINDPSAVVENPGLVEMVKGFESFIPNAYDDYKQTSIGYGTRAKPGEKTISKEEAEKRLLDELSSARGGVEKAVATAGLQLNPNQLDALTSFQYNTGAVDTLLKGGARSPEEIAQAMLLYNKAGGKTLPGLQKRRTQEAQLFASQPTGIQPGAPKSTARQQTPTQVALDEANLAKIQAETATAAKEKAVTANKASSKLARLDRIEKKYVQNGKPTQALIDATGLGEGVASFLRVNEPATRSNQNELELEFLEGDLLEAAKDLKPVSEDEMKQLIARRPALNAAPEQWVWYIDRIKQVFRDGMGGEAAVTAPASASDRLRNRINGQ